MRYLLLIAEDESQVQTATAERNVRSMMGNYAEFREDDGRESSVLRAASGCTSPPTPPRCLCAVKCSRPTARSPRPRSSSAATTSSTARTSMRRLRLLRRSLALASAASK